MAVQAGLTESPASVASTVDSILGNADRGWRKGGWRFQRVSTAPYDFVVELAIAQTTDYICGKYGIHTGGRVNFRGGPNVVVNLDRWDHGTNGTTTGATPYDPATYRILAVNHEVGHALAHGHVTCPSTGGLAPVIMTSTSAWAAASPTSAPDDANGNYVDGPAAY